MIDFILSSHKDLQSLDFAEKNSLKITLLDALNSLKQIEHKSPKQQSGKTQNDSFLIITSEENNILQSLKQKVQTIGEYHSKFKALSEKHKILQIEANDQKTKQMQNIDTIINETFKKLHIALDEQHKSLLAKSDAIKQTEAEQQDTDTTFNQQIEQCLASLNVQKELVTNAIAKYQQIMTNSVQCVLFYLHLSRDTAAN